MIKNARVALAASLFLGGCFVDDPAMFDRCKDDYDCSNTILVSSCVRIEVDYDSGPAAEQFCTTSCAVAGGSCDSVSSNEQLAYCAGLTAGGLFTTGAYTDTICLERCTFNADCSPGFVCADSKTIDIEPGVRVCIPGENYVIPDTAPYEHCFSDEECSEFAPYCDDVSAKWNGYVDTFVASICTDGCEVDADCPDITVNGITYQGTCMPPGVLSSLATCAQACEINSDCVEDFACADADELVGVDPGFDICAPFRP